MVYEPEKYWDEVARRIGNRNESKIVAGDDEPFYRYKRKKFLNLFRKINFSGKMVLEVGPGPGGNLTEVMQMHPKELHGADISKEMISVATELLKGKNVQLKKIVGGNLPYVDNYFDIAYSVTVLQHNSNEEQLRTLVREMTRVTNKDIFIFEGIEKKIKGTALYMGRPVAYYETIFGNAGFQLKDVEYLNIQASYFTCGAIRKLFNKRNRKEGEPSSSVTKRVQKVFLPLTKKLDNLFKVKRDLAMLHFSKE